MDHYRFWELRPHHAALQRPQVIVQCTYSTAFGAVFSEARLEGGSSGAKPARVGDSCTSAARACSPCSTSANSLS